MSSDSDHRRELPAVDALARSVTGLAHPTILVDAARRVLSEARSSLADEVAVAPSLEELREALTIDVLGHRPLVDFVNATGVLLHTNLGRAPLRSTWFGGSAVVDLEFDRISGRRGHRLAGLERAISTLVGAEAALVVNNNAAAVLLMVTANASGGRVIVARGEMVEIGGSFRVPEVIVQGGAELYEVGTTNCLHARDLDAALSDAAAMVLQVHPSNFTVSGFTSTVSTASRAEIAHRHGVPLLVDAGAGLIDERCPWLVDGAPKWLAGEPGVLQLLAAGADIVAFSADKLVGGPQGGVIVGRRDLVERCRAHPLARAVRFDKLRAIFLERVIHAYIENNVREVVPLWAMVAAPLSELDRRARNVAGTLRDVGQTAVTESTGAVGAGCCSHATVPDVAVTVDVENGLEAAARLRRDDHPVLVGVRDREIRLHLRSVLPCDDERMIATLRRSLLPT